ncbi:MAG: DUF3570 domain-containing protein [Burkholderiaceae bacterium]|nr:DUF3570 domain-containing protein [Burkholderiaceae bacterium]MCX8004717.1 DUF3570 domain-containing protein [Burkholderiaceae bacterium]
MERHEQGLPGAPRGSVLAAALVLPGIAAAEGAPTEGVLAFKYLYYKDQQPSLDRIQVLSPSLYTLLPMGSNWSLEGSLVYDGVSGATPRYHSAVSSASRMEDKRTAGDLKITRYFRRAALGLGAAFSTEDDYKSVAGSVDLRLATDDNNTVFALGAGATSDRIDSTGGAVVGEKKRVNDFLLGVTQVLSPVAIAKVNLTHSRGRGFYSDPYKVLDVRPRERDATALLGQYNRAFPGANAVARTSYRYYRDTFEIRAHTFTLDWAQSVGPWTLTPALRYHSQSAAFFYFDPVYDPVLGAPFPPGYTANPPRFSSADHRLSAFGAVTVGLKVARSFGRQFAADARYDYYEQRGDWRLGGKGSPGLEPFSAHMLQVGVTYKF